MIDSHKALSPWTNLERIPKWVLDSFFSKGASKAILSTSKKIDQASTHFGILSFFQFVTLLPSCPMLSGENGG